MTFKQRLIKLKNRFLKPEWREDLYGWKSWFPLRSKEQPALDYDYGDLYTIREDWWKDRPPGISCMLRVKNEAEFIEASLRSVKDFFDEFVIVYNLCSDGTEEAVRQAVAQHGIRNVREYQYPFPIFPPWHANYGKDCDASSIHSLAFYYNWCQSLTCFSHVSKWDGDNVALSTLTNPEFKKLVLSHNTVWDRGQDICLDFPCIDTNRTMIAEAHYYRIAHHTRYVQGHKCEIFKHAWADRKVIVEEPNFLHFKMAKKEYRDEAKPGEKWPGEFPDWLYEYRDELLAREALASGIGRRRPLEHEAQPELVSVRNRRFNKSCT